MRLRYLGRKLLQLVLTLFAVVAFNFLLFRVLPGDPIQLYARSGRRSTLRDTWSSRPSHSHSSTSGSSC